jgi:hypothetical protein
MRYLCTACMAVGVIESLAGQPRSEHLGRATLGAGLRLIVHSPCRWFFLPTGSTAVGNPFAPLWVRLRKVRGEA